MADNNKAVGSLAAAKLVTLIKAETAKKYDKTGGKIEGSAEITGGLKVGMSSEFSSSIKAGSEISSDMLLMAPIVALYDPAKEESISFGVSGENAAKVTSHVSGGGVQYARLAVGTPAGDNDAATKAYVDSKSAVATASANGLMSAADKVKLDGVEAGANKTTVDAALDAGSANPVQNKAVKAALDSKLSTLGGEISGNLDVGLTVGAGGSVSTGVTRSDSGIHFEKAASDAGRISHGAAGVDDTVPLARLKVASPTEEDDAATKAYVDNNAAGAGAVRYDAAQTLTFEQQKQARKNIEAADSVWPTITGGVSLCPEHITDSNFAAHVTTTIASGDDYTVTFDGGPENALVRVDGIRTPTDADTDAAANVEYVKTKISEVSASGGVIVDTAMSNTSTNPVQNKVIKKYVDDSAAKKLNQTEPVIKDGVTLESGSFQIYAQPNGQTSATGEDFASLDFSDNSPQGTGAGIVISGLANFGDAEAAGLEDTAVSYAQLVAYTTPLTLTYDNNQVTGASYADIRKAITRGRQIKLAVANTTGIIVTNAKNEADKSVLKFVDTDVGGDTVSIAQYTVTAQASGLTCNVKSHELA